MFQPRIYRKYNKIEFINEAIVYVCSLHLFLFTDFVAEKETQYTLGFTMIGLVSLLTGINLVYVFTNTARYFRLVFIKYSRIFVHKVKKYV